MAAPELASNQTLYIVIGMAAAMGAVLNAPLAAILAVIELTQTVGIAMPALLAIVAANLTNTGIFRQRSAHQAVLRQLRRNLPDDPLNQLLHRTDVTSTMDVRVVRVPVLLTEASEPLLEFTPTWCLIHRERKIFTWSKAGSWWTGWQETRTDSGAADLTGAGIRRWTVASVPCRPPCDRRWILYAQHRRSRVCLWRRRSTGKQILHGVVTRESIEKFSLSRF